MAKEEFRETSSPDNGGHAKKSHGNVKFADANPDREIGSPYWPWGQVASKSQLRIEALRAAAPIVAILQPSYGVGTKFTLDMAEQYARWLATGER